MLAIPRPMLELLGLEVGATVGVGVDGRQLVVEPQIRPKYNLEGLLALGHPEIPLDDEDRAWLNSPSVGKEL